MNTPAGAAVHLRRLADVPDLAALAARHPARYPLLLESAAHGTPRARFDLLLALPGEGIVLDQAGLRTLTGESLSGTFLDALDQAHGASRVPADDASTLPFCGGWALLLGYELAAEVEPTLRLPPAPPGPPTALALRCHGAVVIDHEDGCAWVVAESAEQLQLLMADAPCRARHADQTLPAFEIEEDDPQRFLDGVHRIKEYLAAGDVFQVNLSRGWRATPGAALRPEALYQSLRQANPAPFAGMFQHAHWAVLSSSPERLVSVAPRAAHQHAHRGGARIETRPIAGTRARSDDAGHDAAAIAELLASPKERAEHVMLIDLERNDLGRVCVPGSVVVEELMAVESYRHVHHIESTVAGILREDAGPGAAIRAVFPGGTITGCPKVRCMQVIAALEGEGRGAYTGAMGYLSRDGRMDLNILIRTLVWDGNAVRLRAGAGIVADSDPDAELAETRAKARGLLRALQPGPRDHRAGLGPPCEGTTGASP